MTSPQARKGAHAEREIAALLTDLTGWPIRRRLQEGRADDTGDLEGIPDTVVQVKNYRDIARAIREGVNDATQQQAQAGTTFAAAAIRHSGGRWTIAMTPEQFATLLREATA